MKKFVIVYFLFLSILMVQTRIQAQNASFSGRVYNGTLDSMVVANQVVTLQLFRTEGHAPGDVATAKTRADGRFTFSITAPDTGANYLAMTEHDGVRYYSEPAHFAHGQHLGSDIVVFDSTRSNRSVVVLMHHLFLQDAGEVLALRETRIFNNPSQKTIINAIDDGHEHGAILNIQLPPWAQNITPIASRYGNDLHVHQQQIYDVGVFEPGNRQVSFAYELPWQRDRANLVIQIYQATRTLDLFLADQGLQIEGPGLIDHGPFNIRGTNYHRYGIADAAAGTRLQVQISRKVTAENRSLPPYLTLVAAGALLLFGISLARIYRPKAAAGMRTEDQAKLQAERQELIRSIAQLELEPDYRTNPQMQQERAELFDHLERLEMRRLKSGQRKKSGKK